MFIQKRKIVLKMGSKNWLHVCVIALLALFVLTFFIAAASAEGGYSFITKWGSEGTGDGQFQYPFGVAVDSSGDVFVTDSGNHRIQKFDSSGGYITKWGSEGTGDGQFCHHYGVAVDSSGDVFVADTYNHRIQKFDSSGGFITKWGSSGTGDGQFDHPHGVAVDSSGDVFVADTYNNRIQKFDSSGTYITKWGSYGTGDGQFFAPYGVAVASSGDVFVADTYNHGVAVASSGDVFVADTYNHRIQKFDSSGTYITKWGSYGTGDGQFDYPHGVAVDSSGDVFVADTSNHRIQMSDSSGGFITKWGSPGTGDGQFDDPSGVAVDSSGDVFVADSGNNRIQKFGEGSAPPPPPPHVTGIMPGCGHPGQTVDVSITGTDFRAVPMTVELQRDAVTIGGTDVLLISDTLLTCKFDLTGAPRGLWDVYLKHNDDDQSSTLPGAFDVQFRPPYVTGVNPDFGHPGQTVDVSITGTDFRRVPTTVELQRGVETPIVGTDVSYDSDTLVTCKLDLTDAPLGAWDVYVKHNDDGQSSTLPGAFDVQFRPPDVTSVNPDFGHPDQTLDVSITGTDFRRVPTTVELQRGVETPIVGTDVSYDSDTLVTCKLDLTSAQRGLWDVYLKHNDDGQSSTLGGAFFVHWPAISVSKTASTNGVCPGSDPLAVNIGDTVTYCFIVSNTGDVTLTSVTVNDDVYGPVTLGTTTLAPGETTLGTITHIVTESDVPSVTDTATATGTDPLGGTVTDTDDCTINVALGPDIAVIKTASITGTCPGSDPLAVSIGDTVTYCFNVSNTGDVNLIGVTVIDDIYGPVTLGATTLAPGETTEGTLTHVVTESDVPSVTNIATATGTDPLAGTVTDSDPCTINVAIAPGIEVVKTASLTGTGPGSDPLAVSIGDTVTYCFNVTNTGDVTLTNVAVSDNIYGPVTLGTTTLAPGETTEGTITHIVVESDAPSVIDIATATGTDPLLGTVTDTDDCTINVAIAPDIAVVKTASLTGTCPGSDPLAVSIGDTVTYCFIVSNTGDVTLTNVAVSDNIYGPVTLGTTTLAPGETTEGTLTHIVVGSDAPSVTDIATATGTDPLGGTVTDTDPCTINVTLAPDIEVVKTASITGTCPGSDPLAVSIGDTVTYCFDVSNTGDVTLTSVTVNDDIYGPVTLGTTTLAPGETTEGTITHVVTESDVPSVTNTATATGTDPLGGTVTDTDPCTINVALGPDIEVVKTASLTGSCPGSDPLAVSIGDTVTYCFNVTNTGDVNLIGVTVNDDIYGPVTLGTTTLAPGETTEGTITHVVVVSDAPSVTNTATANGTDPCGVTVTNTDPCTINVAIAPGIEVVKTASLIGTCPGSDPLAVSIGDTVTYCFIVSNTGDVSLTSVTVNDDIYGSVTLGTTTLAPGETTEGTLTHVVTESDVPSVTNIATATGTPPVGAEVTDTDPCTINVALAPDIEVVKTASLTGTCPGSDPLAVSIGDTVTYCFNVSNTGDVTLTNVAVSDNIYGPVTLGTTTLAPGETTEGTLTHIVVESYAPSVTDTATATGTPPVGAEVTDTDPCTINVALGPGIAVVKTASLTGTCPGSDPLAVSIGDTVTYCFNVSNTGDVTLTSVTVNDDIYGPVTLGTTTLAPGETTEGTLTHIVVVSDAPSVTDIATATGTDPLGGTVTDTDPCTINVTLAPDIEVVKTASITGTCPGSDPLAVSINDMVTYCFNVSNTGDVNLTGVTVNDDIYGLVTLGTTTLAPGETTEGTLTHIVTESDAPSATDIATATGTDPLGGTVTDTDPCTINVALGPDIEVVKTASLTGSCPGSDPLAVNIGDTVTYCFNVSNTGDVNLIGVMVIDDIYGPVTLGTTTLAPGETTGGTLTHIVTESDVPSVTNIATVNATDIDNNRVSDTDDCTINVEPSPCFIATAAYGTALHEDINVLREFRDEYLVTNPAGRVFVKIYYTTSPPIAALIRNNEGLSTTVREGFVKPLVYITRRFVKGGGQNG